MSIFLFCCLYFKIKIHHHHHHHHVVPLARISLTLSPYLAAVCMFKLVVLLLLGHMRGSIGVHHWWVRPCFSSSVLRFWRHRILRHCCRSTTRDTLASYLFIICLDYVLRTSIDKIRENGFELSKKRSRRYPAKTITDADYADDIALLANTPNQAETLLQSLERATAGIGLHVNALKTECMCYNQTGDISTLDGTSLKQVDKFTYLGSSVSSTEKDIDPRLTKAWTAVDRLSIIWKSDLTDEMNAVSSRQRSYRYCYMDALLGR